jgi:hypothetical protein
MGILRRLRWLRMTECLAASIGAARYSLVGEAVSFPSDLSGKLPLQLSECEPDWHFGRLRLMVCPRQHVLTSLSTCENGDHSQTG